MSRANGENKQRLSEVTPPPIPLVLDVLEQLWKQESQPAQKAFDEPLDGLIMTVLSQNTNDRNRDMAYEQLRRQHGAWDNIARLSQAQIAEAIKSAGICNNKAATILRVLSSVKDRFGKYSLKALKKMSPDEARDFMTSIPGVGPKTAACVLAFDLSFPAFPVDTHVARISKRLHWADENKTPAEIQEQMEEAVPDNRKSGGHLNIIQHGKNICKARNPLCGKCPLRGLCPSSTA
ncbi:MAG: endonuclease III [Pyramidobacter sp.]|nr:endonuclease III [Pyramidobacter sp.]